MAEFIKKAVPKVTRILKEGTYGTGDTNELRRERRVLVGGKHPHSSMPHEEMSALMRRWGLPVGW